MNITYKIKNRSTRKENENVQFPLSTTLSPVIEQQAAKQLSD
jgi:hypothetical protein